MELLGEAGMATRKKKILRRKRRMDNEDIDLIIDTLQSYGWNITTNEEE